MSASWKARAACRGIGWPPSKRLAGGITLFTAAALLRPLAEHWRAESKDSFPLSHYPMFSLKRSDRARVTYLVGIDADGGRHRLPYRCAGMGGLNQVRRQINRAVREGRAELLCETVASSPLLRQTGSLGRIVEVQIVTGTYGLTNYFSGKTRSPMAEKIHATRPTRRVAA